MMRQLITFFLVVLGSHPVMAASWFGAEFSADLLLTSPQQENMQGRLYASGLGIRTEYQQGELQMVEIIRPEQQKAWLLFPQQETYMERPFPSAEGGLDGTQSGDPCADMPWARCTRQGEESLNGRSAVKWKIVSEQGDELGVQWVDAEHHFPVRYMAENRLMFERRYVGDERVNGRATQRWESATVLPDGRRELSYQWYDAQLNIAIRQQTANGYLRELRNIEIGSQPPALFELPAGYRLTEGMEQAVPQ